MSSDDRRHLMEEKTFAVVTAESINVMAESAGHQPIPHEAAAALGEDVSYRMRQLVMTASQYMKHSKRRRMTTEDFNKAAQVMGLMPALGHGSQEPTMTRHVKDADVHVIDDPEVNLSDIALASYVPRQIGQPSIKAHWLAVEGVVKIAGNNSQGKGREMSATHLKYYNLMTKALLGANTEAKKKALQDLRTNPNLVPVLPYLVNFVVSGIKNMSHDIGQLTTMLNTVRALLHNRSLYLMHKPYLTVIVQGVEFCVLETLAASISSVNDHWVLRDFAARLLAEIINRWNSPQNHLRFNTIKLLKEVLHDTTKSFYSHYGAIMSLIALGHKAIEDVILPHLPTYWPHLKAAMEDRSPEHVVNRLDSQKVYGALRVAGEKIMRRHIRRFEVMSAQQKEREELAKVTDPENITFSESQAAGESFTSAEEEGKNVFELYTSLYEYFGDGLAHCLPIVDTYNTFKPNPKDDLVSLGDQNSGKSGEELLDNLMEQIKLQEKLEQERKEREQKERKERERRERERRARQAIEQKKREEEERRLRLRREEEDQKRRRLEALDEERHKRCKEEEEKRQKDWEEQMKELNKNRNKPQWQQLIELRRLQLEEEMQYSRMLEASKRQEGRERAKREEEEEKARRQREEEELLRKKEEEDELAGRSRVGLRRRKPVNYTEKDEDISDLFDDPAAAAAAKRRRGGGSGHHSHHRGGLKLNPNLPPHSDISDDSDSDLNRRLAAGLMSPGSAEAAAIAVSKVIDPSKGLLKLKIRRQGGHGTGTPPHPMSSGTPQHTPSSSFPYHSPSMLSPMYSPHSVSIPTPPPPTHGASTSAAGSSGASTNTGHQRSKSSSGSEKESKHKRGGGGESSGFHRSGSSGIQDISDPDEPFTMDPPLMSSGGLPPMMYSPGGESSGSDSNPHRKALKLKLKLTPKDSASE
ncbi:taf6-like RNA polymerase ii p300/cbp-associated factor-associated factor 65 kda subunit 6l [Plakobranchus ocellatus]|uniref:Histone H4 n=1 Tax=Plakobranchus ocellatus TaxID=259542 RepID=A0AAV4DVZ1_9GAST|nr:taf6-like RNA polymerase ii p300/cbp-associated factor-associated factor 65 kda subunit 6l [Plakobranchus ocellatus]